MALVDKRQRDAEGRLRRGERVQIQVSEETAEEVIEAAQKERRALSQMLRVIVEEWAESHRRQKQDVAAAEQE